MQSSGDGTQYRLYVGHLYLSSPGIPHDTRNSSCTHWQAYTYAHDLRTKLLYSSLFSFLTKLALANLSSGRLNPGSRLKSLSTTYCPFQDTPHATSFACRHVPLLFSMAVRSFFESAGYVRYLKINLKFHVVQAAPSLYLFPDLISMKNKALYSYFAWILIYFLV